MTLKVFSNEFTSISSELIERFFNKFTFEKSTDRLHYLISNYSRLCWSSYKNIWVSVWGDLTKLVNWFTASHKSVNMFLSLNSPSFTFYFLMFLRTNIILAYFNINNLFAKYKHCKETDRVEIPQLWLSLQFSICNLLRMTVIYSKPL